MNILAGVLFGLFFLTALFLFIDPFNLNIYGRITGRYDAIAAAMPADTQVYVSVNLLNFNQERLARLQRTFDNASQEAASANEYDELNRELDQFLEELEEEWDLRFDNDVLPWIGQYAGLGVYNMRFNQFGFPERGDILAAIEVRQTAEADAFLSKLIAGWERNEGGRFIETIHQNVTIYELDRRSDSIAFARSGSVMYIGGSAAAIRQGINAQRGQNLAASSSYRQTVQSLPGDRGVTAYFTADLADDAARTMQGSRRIFSRQGVTAMAVTLTLVDEGLRLDSTVLYEPDNMSQTMAEIQQAGAADVAGLLPANTIGYLSGSRPDLLWALWRDSLIDTFGQADFNESMRAFEDTFGFDPDKDLFPLLDGDWAVVLVPGNEGFLAEDGEINLGWAILLETCEVSNSGANVT
jgi:hypothetical protein